MRAGEGGGIGVDTGRMEATAGALRSASLDVAGACNELVAALAGVEDGVGDPAAAGALGDLIQAWTGPLGLLAPLLERLSSAVSASAGVYTTTDAAVARHVQ